MKRLLCLAAAFCLLALCPGVGMGAAKKADEPIVKLETNMGDILIQLDGRKAPRTTANFIQYVKSGHYDGTIFHRVIKGFMIQAGGFTPELREKRTLAPIRNEADNGLRNKKYTIAMARTNDPHSATAQFFINTKDNAFLDFKGQSNDKWGYAVFGHVIEGQKVVDRIESVLTGRRGPYEDVPEEPVIIKKAYVVDALAPQAE